MSQLISPTRTRPRALAALGLALALSACSGTPPTITPGAPAASGDAGQPNTVDLGSGQPTVDPNAKPLGITVVNTEMAPGDERLIFRVTDAAGKEVADGNVTVGMYRLMPDGKAAKAASGAAAYFGAGQPEGGNWVVYTNFDASGSWGLEVDLDHPTLGKGHGRTDIEVSAKPRTPKVGDKPVTGESPVATGDLSSITSDPAPDASLYAMTVAQAMASGKPSVVLFASPGHCASQLCAAAMVAMKQVKAQMGDKVNFIHIETRDLTDPTKLSATTQAWGVPSEPWTFVLDKAGRVNTRMEGGLDAQELGAVLQQKLGVQ